MDNSIFTYTPMTTYISCESMVGKTIRLKYAQFSLQSIERNEKGQEEATVLDIVNPSTY